MGRQSKPVIGRPPIAKEKRKAKNVTFRTRDDLHRDLSVAADAAGRSLSEEIEYRLERSLTSKRLLTEALELTYGPSLARLFFAIGEMAFVGLPTRDDSWIGNAESYRKVWSAIEGVMLAFRPEDGVRPTDEIVTGLAQFELSMIRVRAEPSERDLLIRDLLGSLMTNMKVQQVQPDGDVVFK